MQLRLCGHSPSRWPGRRIQPHGRQFCHHSTTSEQAKGRGFGFQETDRERSFGCPSFHGSGGYTCQLWADNSFFEKKNSRSLRRETEEETSCCQSSGAGAIHTHPVIERCVGSTNASSDNNRLSPLQREYTPLYTESGAIGEM